jgi:flagellar hook-length control protein FliK
MNIERQGAGTSPRIDSSSVSFARAAAVDGESDAADGAPPSFAAMLTALDSPAPCVAAAGGADPLGSDHAVQEDIPIDPAVFLDGGLRPALNDVTDGQGLPVDPAVLTGLPLLLSVPVSQDANRATGGLLAGRQAPVAPPTESFPVVAGGPAGGPGALTEGIADAQEIGAATGGGQQHVPQRDGSMRRNSSMGLSAARQSLSSVGDANAVGNGDGARANGESIRFDVRGALAAQSDRASFQVAPAFEVASGGFRSLLPFQSQRSSERVAARSVFAPLDGALAGNNATSVLASYPATGAGGVAAPDLPFPAGASSEVAHKVHYWVTRGAQNAELQLDAFGGGAVDVSISIRGNEAQVEFRSDQPEARRLLQDAMPQLRDLLRSEGLELSGGFVGGSANPDSRRERSDPEGRSGRDGVVTVPGLTSGPALMPVPAQQHGLDVFV